MSKICRYWLTVAVWLYASVAMAEPTAEQWLQRMANAVEFLNYQGSLVYMAPGRAETFRVFHRVERNKVTERLIALDGAGAEIIRNDAVVICIFPDTQSVVVEARNAGAKHSNPLQSRLPAYSSSLNEHYRLSIGANERILGRPATVVDIAPRDDYRYGYRLWLDADTAMPLKAQLIGEDAAIPVEEIRFTEIKMPGIVDVSAVQTGLDTTGYSWVLQNNKPGPAVADERVGSWRADEPPAGFELVMSAVEVTQDSPVPRTHLVYTDGLATVSVFVDMGVAASEQAQGLAMMGAANAYSVMRDGLLLTAIGEVPPRTVEKFAYAMRAD
ncbi:MAG: MucB/RseB C-terminal domain-containing protein [Gammaproteobacteria bacterium]|nr:MucB/RseB C-terminal domain-containing protein [Gammaproteobacteria bacterium]